MRRKGEGSILVFSVFVFLFVNICIIGTANLISSATRYSKYNYENLCIEELCLSNVELAYSKILEEVQIAIDTSKNYEEFENYFTKNESIDFIDKIQDTSLKRDELSCSVNREIDLYSSENSIYYRILSDFKNSNFKKVFSVYIKIENPFDKNLEEGKEIDKKNLKKAKELVTLFAYKEV